MEKLERLTVSELMELYHNCSEKDNAKIIAEIERKSGINISEEEESLKDTILEWLTIGLIVVFMGVIFIAALKIIHFFS